MTRTTPVLATALLLSLGLAACSQPATPPATGTPAPAPAADTATTAVTPAADGTDGTAPAGAANASGAPVVPVLVGGEAETDPCMSASIEGGAEVEILSGPGTEHPRLASLPRGTVVHMCDPGDAHFYAGIVWGADETVDCGLSSPVPTRAPYAGNCHSGWVLIDKLNPLAG
jgi:hypothetical protein